MTIALDPPFSDTARVGSHTQLSPAVSDPSCPGASEDPKPNESARPGTLTSDEAKPAPSTHSSNASSEPSSPATREWPHTQSTGAVGDPTSTRTDHGFPDAQTPGLRPGGTQTSGAATTVTCTHIAGAAPDPNFTDRHHRGDAHAHIAVGEPSSPAPRSRPTPKQLAARGDSTTTGAGQTDRDAHEANVLPGDPQTSGSSHRAVDAQTRSAAAGPHFTESHQLSDTQSRCALPGGWLRDPVIGVLADVLDDLEKVRIANSNRVRILTRNEPDADGEERGFGLTEDHPEVKKLILTVEAMKAAEHDATLNLQRALRKHPLAAFQKRHKGLGEKQFARLLAVLGDPYYNDLHQRPRTVSELWAYCGFHVIQSSGSQKNNGTHLVLAAGSTSTPGASKEADNQRIVAPGVAPKRTRGQQSNWSEDARKRVWVIASAMPKFPGGHYEQVYRDARVKYADAKHPADCVRCGPAGKPALAGSDLSDGHKHARAIRIVAKELLKDIWRESRDLYHPEGAES